MSKTIVHINLVSDRGYIYVVVSPITVRHSLINIFVFEIYAVFLACMWFRKNKKVGGGEWYKSPNVRRICTGNDYGTCPVQNLGPIIYGIIDMPHRLT